MQRFLKSGNAKLYILLAVLLTLAGAWRACDAINARLAALQVKEVPRVDRGAGPLDVKSFYPVWVKQAAATPPRAAADGAGSLDSVFEPKEEASPQDAKPATPPEPDYAQMFKQAAVVDGVSDDGAFVNGRFYAIGQKMEELRVSGAGGQGIVPTIEAIKDGRITFAVGHQRVVFVARGGS